MFSDPTHGSVGVTASCAAIADFVQENARIHNLFSLSIFVQVAGLSRRIKLCLDETKATVGLWHLSSNHCQLPEIQIKK